MTYKPNESGENTGTVNELQNLRYNLSKSVSWLQNGTRELLGPYGITPKQYNILRNLAKNDSQAASIQQVRAGLADKMSDASRLIDRLVKKGYLDKFPSEKDRRSNLVKISTSGKKVFKEISKRRDDLDRLISDRLNEEEIEQLNELLARLQ